MMRTLASVFGLRGRGYGHIEVAQTSIVDVATPIVIVGSTIT